MYTPKDLSTVWRTTNFEGLLLKINTDRAILNGVMMQLGRSALFNAFGACQSAGRHLLVNAAHSRDRLNDEQLTVQPSRAVTHAPFVGC